MPFDKNLNHHIQKSLSKQSLEYETYLVVIYYKGWSPDAQYPESVLHEAQLLHWNGIFKP